VTWARGRGDDAAGDRLKLDAGKFTHEISSLDKRWVCKALGSRGGVGMSILVVEPPALPSKQKLLGKAYFGEVMRKK
jgi:hypothetical protein